MKNTSVEKYFESFESSEREILNKIRALIKEVATHCTEEMSYGIPTYKLNGILVHFGGYKKHIGFYPTPEAIKHFEKELSKYKTSKGAVQFQLTEPIPYDLIKEILKYRIERNLNK